MSSAVKVGTHCACL